MQFLANWQEILRHAWSIRLIAAAALFETIAAFLASFDVGDPLLHVILIGIGGTATAAAGVARILSQKTLSDEDPEAMTPDDIEALREFLKEHDNGTA